jgi:hypothetical protein
MRPPGGSRSPTLLRQTGIPEKIPRPGEFFEFFPLRGPVQVSDNLLKDQWMKFPVAWSALWLKNCVVPMAAAWPVRPRFEPVSDAYLAYSPGFTSGFRRGGRPHDKRSEKTRTICKGLQDYGSPVSRGQPFSWSTRSSSSGKSLQDGFAHVCRKGSGHQPLLCPEGKEASGRLIRRQKRGYVWLCWRVRIDPDALLPDGA